MFKFEIPFPPITKKNSPQILINHKTNRPFIMPSKQYKDYEKKCSDYFKENDTVLPQSLDLPVNVKATFYMPTRRLCDLTNLLGALDDVLVFAGVIVDDNRDIVAGHDGSRVMYDKENPRTVVEITEMEGYDRWKD